MVFGIKTVLLAGVLSSIIGFVFVLGHIDTPQTIGPSLAVACLTLFYGVLIALIMHVFRGRLHKLWN